MWQSLQLVAKNRFLSEQALITFADVPANRDRFGLSISGMDTLVNTWHEDGMIDAFKKTQLKECLEMHRQQAVGDQKTLSLSR